MTNPGEGITAPPELFERMRSTLDGGTQALSGLADAAPPGTNSGESTAPLVETLGKLLEASAGVLAGTEEIVADVHAVREGYLNDDDAAAGLFRRDGQ